MNIFTALESLATRHDRSTEAEVRQAIQAWVEPSIIKEERNTRRKVVAERLTRLLQQVNASRHGAPLRPSHVAKGIGEDRAEKVEGWFIGEEEPTFAQLDSIARLFGINTEWLEHGDGSIYPVEYMRLPDDPEKAVEWLTTWDNAHEANDTVKTIHLIRSMNDVGGLYIVKVSSRSHFRVYHTPVHVSEQIGAGGEASLTNLFVTLELLYTRWTKSGAEYHVAGHQLSPSDTTQLVNGQNNPGAVLHENGKSMWWEDIWDRAMVEGHNYWPGWRALCGRIEQAISHDTRLMAIREKIRSGELH